MTIKSVAHNNLTTDFKKYFKIHYITLYLYSLFIRCSYKKMVFVILFHYHQQSIEESGDYFAALSQSHVFSCCPWQLQMVWRYLQTAVTSSEWSCISWWLQILQIETAADAADGDDKHLSPDMIECAPPPGPAWPGLSLQPLFANSFHHPSRNWHGQPKWIGTRRGLKQEVVFCFDSSSLFI